MPPGTPQRNGVSERHNCTLLDIVKSMMFLTDLLIPFWDHALETAAFTKKGHHLNPLRRHCMNCGLARNQSCRFLKVWGCDAYVKRFHPDKLKPKSEKCVFIGYPKETVGYTFYHRSEGKTIVAKNGSFLEKEFLSKEVSGRKVELDEVTIPAPLLESSSSQKSVPVTPTPISEEANDDDHVTSE